MSLRMLDLCAGLGGASQAMRERGWFVVTLDLEPSFRPSVVGDLARLPIRGQFDLVWASPPCTEFSRESMPWCRTGKTPDMALVLAAKAAIEELNPRWWVIENVRGASRYLTPILGRPRVYGPWFLWGVMPPFDVKVASFKEKLSSTRRAERAKVSPELSHALATAIEGALPYSIGRTA